MSDLAAAVRSLRYAGLDAVREFVSRTYYAVGSRTDPDPVLDADWDLLVVLDACRADVFADVVGDGDYSFDVGDTATSPASTSTEWLESVFGAATDDELADVAYVTGNPYTTRTIDTDRFGYVDEVWKHAWDDDTGTIPPRPLTDAAIRAGREADTERLVVHYMQPHFPTVFGDDDGIALDDWGDQPMSVWEELRFGKRSEADVWADYERNLEAVLEDVELLLSNVDADTAVLTADHGNAFGEHHIYGHPGGVDIPALREVPWCVTSATDEQTRDPGDGAAPATDETDADVVDERLESLGYKT
ncbi:alkaline phosphatase family protein [Halobacterium litoreum]|uniref:AlkP-core domain protein n=1 Tax=Halobacterium litoreum TaxID=2039234 RepID=A0ABD5NDZ4_9EURY|nr:hypothetical protein [Halobacterium litoreum]UHH13714.1 hypothetical protein LT972_01655 [Halobacterium litoreum]